MFKPLPDSMPRLEEAVRLLDSADLKPPPAMMEIGRRLRVAYAAARPTEYTGLGRSEVRKLPFAYWLDGEPDLKSTEPQLVRLYWGDYLPEAIKDSPRRAKRWLVPLLYTYCEHFDPGSAVFRDFSEKFVRVLRDAEGLFAERLRHFHEVYRFFTPAEVPPRLASYFFLNETKSIDYLLEDLKLWPAFVATKLGMAAFGAGLKFAPNQLRDAQTVSRLMDWASKGPAPVVKTVWRASYADALLKHWVGYKPADSFRGRLTDHFLKEYGDPRFERHKNYQWDGVSTQAKGVLLNWLTGDTLRGFVHVLQITADKIWEYRQKFWMAYYESGHIDEAWVALGDRAFLHANSLKMASKGMGCGRLGGAVAANQSILIMKMGGLVFTEWSHDGSLRAYREGASSAPRLYQFQYDGTDLRSAESLDFHGGMNMKPELTHAHSDKGSWQRTARDFIRKHTGVHLSDAEIL